MALVPVAIGVAVTRHRLYDLDLAICRALAGAQPGGLPGRVYLSRFAVLRAVLPGQDVLGGALAAGADRRGCCSRSAPGSPAGVDRLYYGDRADRYARDLGADPAAARQPGRRRGAARALRHGRRLAAAGSATLLGRRGRTRCRPARGPAATASRGATRPRGRRDPDVRAAPRRRGGRHGCRSPRAPASARSAAGTPNCSRRSPTRPRRESRRCGCTRVLQRSREALVAAREEERAGCGATCTTGWARRWPGCGCSWSPPVSSSPSRWRRS